MNKGVGSADKLITGLRREEKDRKRQRENKAGRGGVIEEDWHAGTMSLLLTRFWFCCCSTDDETSSQVKPDLPSPVQQGYIGSPWGNPLLSITLIPRVTPAASHSAFVKRKVLKSDAWRVATVQECRTNSRADRCNTVKEGNEIIFVAVLVTPHKYKTEMT